MTPKLSPHTRQLVKIAFRSQDVEQASQWLVDECGNNIPFCENYNQYEMERIRFAAINLSNGRLDEFRKAIDLARLDWRDLLMAAGFGNNIHAHERWLKDILGKL